MWWTTALPDRPPLDDADGDGVPDHVETVAEIADEVGAAVDRAGFLRARSDLEHTGDNGGDAAFDIYLQDIRGADGLYARDACSRDGCTGSMIIENDFVGFGYPSRTEAVRVLVSHEYFHAVQAAYVPEVEGWISEGTATWFEEYYNAEQRDFERLAGRFLQSTDRTLHDRIRGPTDGFSYATGLFFYFLASLHGVEVIRLLLEDLTNLEFEEPQVHALVSALEYKNLELSQIFGLFATWNLFTGTRTEPGRGYPQAADFPQVEVMSFGRLDTFNWDVSVRPLAVSYGVFEYDRDIQVTLIQEEAEGEGIWLAAVDPGLWEISGSFFLRGSDQVLRSGAPNSPMYLIAFNLNLEETRSARIEVRQDRGEPEPDMDMMDGDMDSGQDEDMGQVSIPMSSQPRDEGGCQTVPGAEPRGGGGLLVWLVVGLSILGRRRRQSVDTCLLVLGAVGWSGCIGSAPLPTLGAAKFVRTSQSEITRRKPFSGKVNTSLSILSQPNPDELLSHYGFLTELGGTLWLAERYDLALSLVDYQLLAEGNLWLLDGESTHLGFLHGLSGGLHSVQLGSSGRSSRLFSQAIAGVMIQRDFYDGYHLILSAKYSYGWDWKAAVEGLEEQVQSVAASAGFVWRLDTLELSPELALMRRGVHRPSAASSSWMGDWLFVMGATLSAGF